MGKTIMMVDFALKNRSAPYILAALLTLIAVILLREPLSGIEAAVGGHFWQIMDSSINRERRVVVVDIDQASVAQYGAWPWPRERTTALFESLTQLGVALRIVDIAFPEPKTGDVELAAELLRTPTILAQILAVDVSEPVNMGQLQGAMSGAICDDRFPQANGAIGNAPGLRAAGAGHITPRVDADGVIRKLPAVVCYQSKAYPALTLAAFAEGSGVSPEFTVISGSSWLDPVALLQDSKIPGLSVPIDERGDILLPWWTSRESIVSLSAKDIMEGNVPAEYLQGAWVLLGATAFGIGDTVPTPQAAAVSGVEIHAQLLTALLDERIPYQPRGAVSLQIGWILVTALILMAAGRFRTGLLRVYAPAITGLLLLAATLMIHAILLWAVFLWVPWMASAVFICLSAALMTTQGYWLSRVESELLFRNLSSYLPAHVAKQIASQEPVGELKAHHEQVIVLYADLRNFSAWCDHLPAEQAGALLHNFYSFAGKIIHQYGGVVEEYVGDAVMGVWRSSDCDLRPLQAAKSLVAAGEQMFGAETGINSLPPLAVGIGIEQGEVLVGAFGPARRRNHTLLGRTVTTAMLLQAMTGELSQAIVCGENVSKKWKQAVPIVSLGKFLLKDRHHSTELFVPGIEKGSQGLSKDCAQLTESTVEVE